MTRGCATLRLLIPVFFVAATLRADSIIANGDFHLGLADWTTFTTSNGTLGAGEPQVMTFSPDGINTYDAVQFQVGQALQINNVDLEGGGIFQMVSLAGGTIHLTLDLAVQGSTSENLYGGFAQLLIDSHPVAGYDFGALTAGQVKTDTLNVDELVSQGTHTVAVEYLRPATSDFTTPYQYVYGFQGEDDVPEPSNLGLSFLTIVALLCGRSRPARAIRRYLGRRQNMGTP
jgi:hypothetical protein